MPPSVNALYATNFKTGRRFKSKKYIEWVQLAKTYKNSTFTIIPDEKVLELSMKFYSKWYNLNDTIKKKDLSNYFKALEDYLGEIIKGFDDSMIFRYKQIDKIHSDREEVEIKFKEVTRKSFDKTK